MQYGSTPAYTAATPVRAADAQYTYTFSEWSPSIAQVTGNATYTAEYDTKVNSYTVTFETNGGSSADSQTIDYGGKAVRPADPTKESSVSEVFTFAGWFSDAGLTAAYDFDTPVHGNLTLYAKWDSKVREYTVSFVNHDGTVLQSSDVPYGETPVYSGDEPSKAATAEYSYAFSGWDSPIGSVTGNLHRHIRHCGRFGHILGIVQVRREHRCAGYSDQGRLRIPRMDPGSPRPHARSKPHGDRQVGFAA